MSDKIVSPNGDYELDIDNGGQIIIYRHDGKVIWAAGGDPDPLPPTPPQVLQPLRVSQSRLTTDAGWLHWRGLSEFSAVHLVRTGQEAELVRRLDRAERYGRNGIRVLMMAKYLFDLQPSQPGYWAAADRVVALARERGLYVEACLFADAQEIMPSDAQRRAVCAAFADWCRPQPTVLPQLANEAFKNGWTGATDPALLALADSFAHNYGQTFSISDPVDEPATVNAEFDTLAAYSSTLVLHGDRSSSNQWARWVDHLKGWSEYDPPADCYKIHDEPMGAASTMQPGRRDNRPDAHLAASLVCAVMGIGFTYHYISEQDDATPGLDLCQAQILVPASPDFAFKNAGTPGACVTLFSSGIDKIRTCDNGREAWAVGYGPDVAASSVVWASGWTPQVVKQTPNVLLWTAHR